MGTFLKQHETHVQDFVNRKFSLKLDRYNDMTYKFSLALWIRMFICWSDLILLWLVHIHGVK